MPLKIHLLLFGPQYPARHDTAEVLRRPAKARK